MVIAFEPPALPLASEGHEPGCHARRSEDPLEVNPGHFRGVVTRALRHALLAVDDLGEVGKHLAGRVYAQVAAGLSPGRAQAIAAQEAHSSEGACREDQVASAQRARPFGPDHCHFDVIGVLDDPIRAGLHEQGAALSDGTRQEGAIRASFGSLVAAEAAAPPTFAIGCVAWQHVGARAAERP